MDHPLLCLEVKYRRHLPALLQKAMAQACSYVIVQKLPAVVLFERGQRGGLVVLRLSDFAELFGSLRPTQGGE